MPLETATYVTDLVISNPAHTDGLSQADSHMRLLKATLKATFPNFTSGALASTQAQLDAAVASTLGTAVSRFPLGTAALPGLTPFGNPNTGILSPAANQLAFALGGSQVLLMGGSSLVTTLGVAAPAFASTGAYSGGTGQLVPIGGSVLWFEDALPAEGGYVWANGGAISRAAYPILWTRWGTKYGAGDGSTTFNVPNLCEVVPVGQRAMGSASSRALLATGVLGTSVLGGATSTLLTVNLPAYTPAGSVGAPVVVALGSAQALAPANGSTTFQATPGSGSNTYPSTQMGPVTSGAFLGTAQGGISTPVAIVQPSVAVNYIIRVG